MYEIIHEIGTRKTFFFSGREISVHVSEAGPNKILVIYGDGGGAEMTLFQMAQIMNWACGNKIKFTRSE